MAKFRIDECVVDTDNSTQSWAEDTDWNGNNHISRATGSQWTHQTLYRSRKGRYYIVHESQWQGSLPHAEWVSGQEAARWLMLMEHELPDDIQQFADAVSE